MRVFFLDRWSCRYNRGFPYQKQPFGSFHRTARYRSQIQSFLTLPEPVIRFSKINLPGTYLIDQVSLNNIFINYWEFLKNKTKVQKVFVDNLNDNILFNEENFVNNIKNFILNLNVDQKHGLSDDEIYNKFVYIIIPKTKVIFNLMKKYIKGKLSVVDIVS